ncbi:MAG: endonuclease III [Vicinamibacterales bacterium]
MATSRKPTRRRAAAGVRPAAAGARPVRPRRAAPRPAPAPRPSEAAVARVMRTLAREIDGMELPAIEKISESQQENPFQVLIATLLSARTQDQTTHAASTRLFTAAPTAARVAALTVRQIERLIYPVSFYRNKARFVKATATALVERYGGQVPGTLEELVTLPGVGRKTATLVMILAFQSHSHICVDTHVHRISNRMGWVRTKHPEETEQALYRATHARWWPYINLYLVTWGQNVCRPVYPRCSECALAPHCPRIDVTRTGRPTGA